MTRAPAPRRVRLSRRKGARLPDNTVSVARPTKWGNPFRVKRPRDTGGPWLVVRGDQFVAEVSDHSLAVEIAVTRFAAEIAPHLPIEQLTGRNLACWCALDVPCHADALLELANAARLVAIHSKGRK